ncbi:MAG TPA: hypothetical protein VF789_07450 [Thermoanaerobaculia bacterium]
MAQKQLTQGITGVNPISPRLARRESGFVLFWDRLFPDFSLAPSFQIVDPNINPVGAAVDLPYRAPLYGELRTGAAIPGGYVLLWRGADQSQVPLTINSRGALISFLDTAGNPVGEPRIVNEITAGCEDPADGSGGIAPDADGSILVAYWRNYTHCEREDPPPPSDVWIRRVAQFGQPIGREIRVNESHQEIHWGPQLAPKPEGGFVVVWESSSRSKGDGVLARIFNSQSAPLTPELQVSSPLSHIRAWRRPKVATDPQGNFIVAWSGAVRNSDSPVKVRLFRRDGTPVREELQVHAEENSDQSGSEVAFAPNGTFVVGWLGPSAGNPFRYREIYARRFSASPGEEPCAVAGSQLLCDTGRTGGFPELQVSFGGRPGEVTLLGDWDGDGRDDICAWFRGRFRCDIDHEGPPTEGAFEFGLPTDYPLLGDLDGDGFADICVRRKRQFLCKTKLNNSRPARLILGRGTEAPLLGDLDGDRRDDLCLVEDGRWDCLTRAGTRIAFLFGQAGDRPVLGDLDRDGRGDPCVLREENLLCDTAHDGGAAETSLALDLPPGARPLFGNLDGL